MASFNVSLLKGCRVENGVLYLTTNYPTERVKELSDALYNAFVDYNVPHWKVVACSILDNGRVPDTVIGKISGINMSYVELMNNISKIILSERNGDFYAYDVSEGSERESIAATNEYGHVMITEIKGKVTTTNGLSYFGQTKVPVRCLAKDEFICNCVGVNVAIYMYCKYGRGVIEFEENDKEFKSFRNIVPCRTVYDLTNYVIVKPYTAGDTNVKFIYKSNVDEQVLTEILNAWANEVL